MNTKSEYPVTDSITNVVEASIVTASVMALIACEVTRHVGHKMEGGVYKGVKSSWGLVKGARERLSSYTAKKSTRQGQKSLSSLLSQTRQPLPRPEYQLRRLDNQL